MTYQPPTLRDRIAEALMAWTERNANPQYATLRRSETVRQNAYSRTDAVLAVLADHDRDAARTAARQTTGQDDTGATCAHCQGTGADPEDQGDYDPNVHMYNPTTIGPCPECHGTGKDAPAVGQPAEAHDTEARPPRVQWLVEGYDADQWNPCTGRLQTREAALRGQESLQRRYPDMPTRIVRETTTSTVEDER